MEGISVVDGMVADSVHARIHS
eukprot:COSAG01_NODE_55359_length_325_cov_1.371681_1_plen_21_part_01